MVLTPVLSLAGYLAADVGVKEWSKTYSIGIDPQNIKCLPWTVYLYSRKPFHEGLRHGDIVVFRAQGLEPYFKDGSLITKFIAGLPGDQVEIRDDRAYINGVFWDRLWGLTFLKQPSGTYDRTFTVGDDEVLTMAVNAGSYDGRYWGTIKKDRIIGYAKPIL